MDWEDVKTFLAIARSGGLSGAARSLGVAQTTVGRRLEALHHRAQATLLTKTPSGYLLTPAGERALPAAERMEAEALALERLIHGADIRLDGVVRVATVDIIAAQLIPPIAAALALKHPGLTLEVEADARTVSLARREADLALRFAQFEQHEVTVRRAGAAAYAVYASQAAVERLGPPDWTALDPVWRLIDVLPDQAHLPESRWLAAAAPHAAIGFRTNSRAAQLAAAQAGLGLACLPRFLADAAPDLVRLPDPPDGPPPLRELWLGVHRDARRQPRLRAALDAMIAGLRAAAPRLIPPLSSY